MWVDHEQHVGKGRSKVGAVDVAMSTAFWRVEVFAAWTVEFDSFLIRCIGEADGKDGLGIAVDSRTGTKVGIAVFVEL
jgi:hypothetical protein